MMDGKIILAVIALVIFISWICTIVSEEDKKNSNEADNVKQELDHKRQAGRLEE